jgi:endonuclease YncB( thermonuclease family)
MIRAAIQTISAAALLTGIATATEHILPIVGRATVIDGDTLDIHGERIRLNGVDAPESAQICKDAKERSYRCGATTAKALAKFLEEANPTRCEFVTRDRYGRFVGDCYRADDNNVARFLVRNGLALDYVQHSKGKYAKEESRAKADRLGLWRGTFTPPWQWRAEQRSKIGISGSLPPSDCKIKGNISRKGARIYHLPQQQDYNDTRINERNGERWFCSEEEAKAAGWQPSKR